MAKRMKYKFEIGEIVYFQPTGLPTNVRGGGKLIRVEIINRMRTPLCTVPMYSIVSTTPDKLPGILTNVVTESSLRREV